jgi:hypothetical protein
LSLEDTAVTGAGMHSLARLTTLDLDGAPVTDDGLADVSTIDTLTGLRLRNTQITDAGLAHFRRMVKLTYLELYDSKATEFGIADLSRSLPALSVNGLDWATRKP